MSKLPKAAAELLLNVPVIIAAAIFTQVIAHVFWQIEPNFWTFMPGAFYACWRCDTRRSI